MGDDAEEKPKTLAIIEKTSEDQKRSKRSYTEAEKAIALASLDANGGNVNRTSIAIDVPYATLAGWEADRRAGKLPGSIIQGVKEKRGDLALKLESIAHSIVEHMPGKIAKASLSQSAVALGIVIDKVRILRGQGLDPDPATELCRLLSINRSQLPPSLQLEPGEELPQGFGPVIETQPNPDNPDSYEPQEPDETDLMNQPDDPDKPAN
jgi:hypothetical protein